MRKQPNRFRVRQVIAPSGATGGTDAGEVAIEALRNALNATGARPAWVPIIPVGAMPAEGSISPESSVKFTAEYAAGLMTSESDVLRRGEIFRADWCRLPSGGFDSDFKRLLWQHDHPWCPPPGIATVAGYVPPAPVRSAMDLRLNAMHQSCAGYSVLAPSARLLSVKLHPMAADTIITDAFGTHLSDSDADRIRTELDVYCGVPPAAPIGLDLGGLHRTDCPDALPFASEADRNAWMVANPGCIAPPVVTLGTAPILTCTPPASFPNRAARAAWLAQNPDCPPSIVPELACPVPPPFYDEATRNQWLSVNLGCIAPEVQAESHTALYVAGGVAVAAAAWFFTRPKHAAPRANPHGRRR